MNTTTDCVRVLPVPATIYRLGANEAPPAIMSIFIGTQLTQVLNDFRKDFTKAGLLKK
jgi:glutamine synthetase type III